MIYIVAGPPREGKTFWVTYLALKEMARKGKRKRKVFSNYPIKHKKYGFSYKWDMDLIYDIRDSVIIIDEAYRDVSSRNHKDFTVDQHTAFATNGHNNNDFWIIAQSPARVDVIIREMTNIFFYVSKYCFPFSKSPLWFTIRGYLSESDLQSQDSYSTESILPSKRVKNAYDTHFYGNSNVDIVYTKWFEDLDSQTSISDDQDLDSLKCDSKYYFNPLFDSDIVQ